MPWTRAFKTFLPRRSFFARRRGYAAPWPFLVAFLAAFLISCQAAEKRHRMARDHLSIAAGHVKKCRLKRAAAHLLKAKELSRRDAIIRLSLGDVYFLMGKKTLAEREYQKALKARPDLTEARLNLARVYIERGALPLAFSELARADKDIIYSNYIKLSGIKALAFFEKGGYKQAEKHLEEIEEIASSPSDKRFVHLYLGRALMARNHLPQAESHLIRSLGFCQASPPSCLESACKAQFFLASVYRLQNKPSKAAHHLRVFLNRAGPSHPLRQQAKDLLQQLQKPERKALNKRQAYEKNIQSGA